MDGERDRYRETERRGEGESEIESYIIKICFAVALVFILTRWCHHLAYARQQAVLSTLALTGVKLSRRVHTNTIKFATNRPYLALHVVAAVEHTPLGYVLGGVLNLKVTNGLQTALVALLYQLALIWKVVVAGALVVADVSARVAVCTLTFVGAAIVPFVPLAVSSTLVKARTEEATSLSAGAAVATGFPAVLHGPGSVSITHGDAVVRAIQLLVHAWGLHCRGAGSADVARPGAVRVSPQLVISTNRCVVIRTVGHPVLTGVWSMTRW